jgi:peroxiredoxin
VSTPNPKKQQAGPLPAGAPAPDFTLAATPDQALTLSELSTPAVLIFYPGLIGRVGDTLEQVKCVLETVLHPRGEDCVT